ncbi:polysaccharide pyruvyl transferase family protein [Phocaeicola sp.]
MKIGIITFWETQDNYGQVLQCYALQRILESMGHKPFLIRYRLFTDWRFSPTQMKKIVNPLVVLKHLWWIIKPPRNIMTTAAIDRHFDDFKEKYICSSEHIWESHKELQKYPPDADIYMCGSDQIWYSFYDVYRYRNILKAFYLDFGKKKKVAYAASFGRTDFMPSYYKLVTPLIANFAAVSTREVGGLTVCRQLGRIDAEVVLDPTCLLTSDDYKRIAVAPDVDEPYMLLYILGDYKSVIEQAITYSNIRNLKIYYIGSQGNDDLSEIYPQLIAIYPTVEEWLGWIAGCRLIITNSFHGMAFSILYHRQIVVITKFGLTRHGGDDRFFTLLESVRLLNRIYQGEFEKLADTLIDYEQVEQLLSKSRTHSLDYLLHSITESI